MFKWTRARSRRFSRWLDYFCLNSYSFFYSCISWFLAEDPTLSLDRLYTRTHDQWLLGDLTEVSEPCLPDALFAMRKDSFELNGNYALQLNFVLDICKFKLKIILIPF